MIRRPETSKTDEVEKPKGFDDFTVSLGDIMRGERATMGKSLLDVQRELKIKATYVSAIENADPSAFETPGFIAGYVRSYARYLGLDPEWAYKTFCEEGNYTSAHGMSAEASGAKPRKKDFSQQKPGRDPLAEPSVSFIPAERARMTGIEPRAIGSLAVLVTLIGAIGYGGWSVLQEVQKVQFTPVDQAPGVISTIDPLTPAGPVDEGIETAGLTQPSAEALDRLYRPQALDVPVLVARDGPISAIDPASIGTLAPDEPEPVEVARIDTPPSLAPLPLETETSVQVVADDLPEVVLFAVRPSWVRVQAADGTVIFEKILDAGERYVLPKTEEPSRLRAGNAGSLYFAVNGETYGPAGTGPSVIRNVALAPDLLKDAYTIADLSQDQDLARFIAVAEAQTETEAPSDP